MKLQDTLKKDHAVRPCYVTSSGSIILEVSFPSSLYIKTFSPLYHIAHDFLSAISEPRSRLTYIHEFRISSSSLLSYFLFSLTFIRALSVGLSPDDIISLLDQICKHPLPPSVPEMIRSTTEKFGRVKLVLDQTRYLVKTTDAELLQTLLLNPVIANARDTAEIEESRIEAEKETYGVSKVMREIKDIVDGDPFLYEDDWMSDGEDDALVDMMEGFEATQNDDIILASEEDDTTDVLLSFEIRKEAVEGVKKECSRLGVPMQSEYEYSLDMVNPDILIDLKATTVFFLYI
jgi:DNA excision repair protein ERCC-3